MTEIVLRAPDAVSAMVSQRTFACGRALDDKIVSPLREHGEVVGAIAQHVLRNRARIKLRDESRRNVAAAAGERDAGVFKGSLGRRIVVADGTLEHGNPGLYVATQIEASMGVFTFRTGTSRATQPLVTQR